jgi:hypothetical protein
MKKVTKLFAPILACIALVLTGCGSSDVGKSFSFTEHFATNSEAVAAEFKKKLDLTMPLIKLSGRESAELSVIQNSRDLKSSIEIKLKDIPLDISTEDIVARVDAQIKAIEEKVNTYRESSEGQAWSKELLKARNEAIKKDLVGVTFNDQYYQTYKELSDDDYIIAQIIDLVSSKKI